MALAMLSMLFLFAHPRNFDNADPIGGAGLEERASKQQLSGPSISGATDRGDMIALSAASVAPDPKRPELFHADRVAARIDTVDGRVIRLTSRAAVYDRHTRIAELRGDVILNASTGHEIRAARAALTLGTLGARIDGHLEAKGPEGHLTAGGMEMRSGPDGDDIQLVFTNGVKLVYDGQRSKE